MYVYSPFSTCYQGNPEQGLKLLHVLFDEAGQHWTCPKTRPVNPRPAITAEACKAPTSGARHRSPCPNMVKTAALGLENPLLLLL